MTWELKTARDLRQGHTYVVRGDFHTSARKITDAVVPKGDSVTFTSRGLWSRLPGDRAVTLDVSTTVYILKCTCNGMGYIANRWVFTGECRCKHHALPKES